MEEPAKISHEGKTLHEKLFKNNKQAIVEANSNRPLKDLVADAEEMLAGGKTYKILIKLGSRVDIAGVPFTVGRIKNGQLTLVVFKGYELVKDTEYNRGQIGYVPPEEEKAEAEETNNNQADKGETNA